MPGKFSRTIPTPKTSPVRSTTPALTHEGGDGFSRDAKSELFLLAITNMVGEDTFYEGASERDMRFRHLITQVATEDADWLARFVPYLRNEMLLRSASIVLAAETVHANLEAGRTSNRAIIASALMRADEPGEMLAYWHSRYGRTLPQPVKRGVADAAARLYNERAVIKYDGQASTYRLGDVIELTHAKPKAPWQSALYKYLIDRRHKREDLVVPDALPMLAAYERLSALDAAAFREQFSADLAQSAGLTWETASTRYGALDAPFWESMIPNMGYMALLRNLRNFDGVGVSFPIKQGVVARLADPDEVVKSKQLPLRFYSAWKAAKSLSWGAGLEVALDHSLRNVPVFKGRTLVLVDTSGSMNSPMSARSAAIRYELAALFGSAIALRAENATLVAFGTGSQEIHFNKGDSVLRTVERFPMLGGTQTVEAILAHYKDHDRIVILTDEQAFTWGQTRASFLSFGIGSESREGQAAVEAISAPIYTFNLAGYQTGHLPSGSAKRHTFGGLSDAGFKMISLIERAGHADWPF